MGAGVLGSNIGLPGLCSGEEEQEERGCEQPASTAKTPISVLPLTSHLAPPSLSCRPFLQALGQSPLSLSQGQPLPKQLGNLGRSSFWKFVDMSISLPGHPPSSFPFPLGICPLLFFYRHFRGTSRCSEHAGYRPLSWFSPQSYFLWSREWALTVWPT